MRIPPIVKTVLAAIGRTNDSWTQDKTLLGYSNQSYKHVHNPGYITPDDGTVIRVSSGAGAGDWGAFVDVVAENEIDRFFDIHWLSITDIEVNGVYIIELHRLDGAGASVAQLCQLPVTRNNNFARGGEVLIQIPVQPSNARIGARMRKTTADAKYIEFIAHYHDYQ